MTLRPNVALTSNTDGTRSRSWTMASIGSRSGHLLPQIPVLPSLLLSVLPSLTWNKWASLHSRRGMKPISRGKRKNGKKIEITYYYYSIGRSNNSHSILSQHHHSGD